MSAPIATLNDLASQELSAAVDAVVVGDSNVERYAHDIRKLIANVTSASEHARRTATQLFEDDLMNSAGKARLLAELPNELLAQTAEQLDQAELLVDLVEGAHLSAILKRDGREDTVILVSEIQNYITGLEPATATETLIGLASDVRYSSMMSGPYGRSLAARFKLKDSSIFTKVALDALAINGSADQVARSEALNALKNVRRVLQLSRAGRDQVIEHVRRGPAPKPTAALM
jgi:hypothetical protein